MTNFFGFRRDLAYGELNQTTSAAEAAVIMQENSL